MSARHVNQHQPTCMPWADSSGVVKIGWAQLTGSTHAKLAIPTTAARSAVDGPPTGPFSRIIGRVERAGAVMRKGAGCRTREAATSPKAINNGSIDTTAGFQCIISGWWQQNLFYE
eukprot:6212425-Pleurochrysis_carterae.AAC.14